MKLFSYWPFAALVAVMVFGCYWLAQSLNPNSRWCSYQIYRTTNGTYEVWWRGRSSDCEWRGSTLEEARAYQSNACKSLLEFMEQRPTGERVK